MSYDLIVEKWFDEDLEAPAGIADDIEARGVFDSEIGPDDLIVESWFQDVIVDAPAAPPDDIEARTVVDAETVPEDAVVDSETLQPPDQIEFQHDAISSDAGGEDLVTDSDIQAPAAGEEGDSETRIVVDAETAPEDQVTEPAQDLVVDAPVATDDFEVRAVTDADAAPEDAVVDSDAQEPVVDAQVVSDDIEARCVIDAEPAPDDAVIEAEAVQPPDVVEFQPEATASDAGDENVVIDSDAQEPLAGAEGDSETRNIVDAEVGDDDLAAALAEISAIIDQVVATADLIESIADAVELVDRDAESQDQPQLTDDAEIEGDAPASRTKFGEPRVREVFGSMPRMSFGSPGTPRIREITGAGRRVRFGTPRTREEIV